MRIALVEISSFRKLLAVRIDLAKDTTLFVGANNSGKTSAIVAMRRFLIGGPRSFNVHDLTVSHWKAIKRIGSDWEAATEAEPANVEREVWATVMPSLDLWLSVSGNELHYVQDFLPTLDWTGGQLGIRLQVEPKDPQKVYENYLVARAQAAKVKSVASADGEESQQNAKLTLWPEDMMDYLSKRLSEEFTVRIYALDPTKLQLPEKGQARPQALREDALAIDSAALSDLIRVNEINAQRGFGDLDSIDADKGISSRAESRRLSDQLRVYYKKHLDPTEMPDTEDLAALQAIEAAQTAFNERLKHSFSASFAEVEGLGYPGVTDPKLKVSTQLRVVDGLNHETAVAFEVDVKMEDGEETPILRLPEDNNGLGYQNLISMIFKLMSFRDAWMRVGKAGKAQGDKFIEPLHLVLLEEPEAHLHAQVQQVFINRAYQVLRAHPDLGENDGLSTQLVVSSHSGHVAHEVDFANLRYFRRLPAGMISSVPVSAVINLTEVFGNAGDTERFVTRYLRAQHADLFFADAAILVEGPAERMLVPNFIRAKFPFLDQCYITLLEIGGSHAHRLRPLVEHLGLLTLVVTDIDPKDQTAGTASRTIRGVGQKTGNATLRQWLPAKEDIDALIALPESEKETEQDQLAAVRVAYQMPLVSELPFGSAEIAPCTFEDALVCENIAFFSDRPGTGLVAKFRDAIANSSDAVALSETLFEALRGGGKAEFALDVLGEPSFGDLAIPTYINEGLSWLEARLKKKQAEILLQ